DARAVEVHASGDRAVARVVDEVDDANPPARLRVGRLDDEGVVHSNAVARGARDAAHHVVSEKDVQRVFRFVPRRNPRHGRHYSRADGDGKTTSAYSGQFLNGFLMSLTQRVFANISHTY